MPASSPVPPVAADVAALSFEEALGELERIVKGLEVGQQRLDDAIAAYERGTLLRRHCEAKLAEAEMRVQMIVQHGDGTLTLDDGPPAPAPEAPRAAARRNEPSPARSLPGGDADDVPF